MAGYHCVESVHIQSYSGPHIPAFALNTERYGVSLRIQSECGKMWTRKTPNTALFTQCTILNFGIIRQYQFIHPLFPWLKFQFIFETALKFETFEWNQSKGMYI